VDQVYPSTLYEGEEDKMLLAPLPELHHEQILAAHLERLKNVNEMFSALAVAHQCTGVQVVDPEQKVYVPPMFRSPNHHSLPYFKDTNDDVEPSSNDNNSASSKQPARRTSPWKLAQNSNNNDNNNMATTNDIGVENSTTNDNNKKASIN
jgi:hypothetical protein